MRPYNVLLLLGQTEILFRLLCGVCGLACGDALGVPVEFNRRDSFHVTDMIGYGTYDLPPGTWSDDSSMTLATVESIARLGRISTDDIMQNFYRWTDENAFTPYGKLFDIGYATQEAIKKVGASPVCIDYFRTDELPENAEVISLQREKLYTDTVHCIDNALQKGYDELVVLAATGGRLDHTVANLCALEYTQNKGGRAVLLSEREEIRLLGEGRHNFSGCGGLTFSLFPFGCETAVISVSGAHYPLDRYAYESRNPVGVSNIFEGEISEIEVHSGRLLMIINRDDRYL